MCRCAYCWLEVRKAELALKWGLQQLQAEQSITGRLVTTRASLRKKLQELEKYVNNGKSCIAFSQWRKPWTKQTSDERCEEPYIH